MNNQKKALLPLLEILISTGIFAVAVILTLQMFMLARFLGNRTSDTADAILKVQNVAETLKSFRSGDDIYNFLENETVMTGKTESIFSSYVEIAYNIFYDINWRQVGSADEAVYIIYVRPERQEQYAGILYMFDISLYKAEAYPFINDRIVEQDPQYKPLLAAISVGKFIAGSD